MTRIVYLDAPASTPLDAPVVEAMTDVLWHIHANPSAEHMLGRVASARVEEARAQVAALAGVSPAGVIFTSGATEANSLALRGLRPTGERDRVISCTTEHPAVLRQLDEIRAEGRDVTLIAVDEGGRPDLGQLADALNKRTLLVSIAAANNETGVVADLAEAVELAHAAGALVHTDASQLLAWGALPTGHGIDMITVSGHKMHGPQGVGALIATRDARRLLRPLHLGGGQERGLRSGTTNVAGVVGLGVAARLAIVRGPIEAPRVQRLRDKLHQNLVRALPGTSLNGHPAYRLPGTLNLAFGDGEDAVDAQAVLAAAPTVAASTGSACHSGAVDPSPVLQAMGLSRARAGSSIRLGLSRLSEERDVEEAVPALVRAVIDVRERQAAPLQQSRWQEVTV